MTSRIVLITGANSGVGYATSKVLATASSAFHVIMSGRSLSKVEQAKSEIESTGIKGTLSAIQLDVTDDSSIANAVKHVQDQHGRLDVLLNNAAVGARDPDLRSRISRSLNTNVIGVALIAQEFRPLLLKSKNPYSIFVSSGAGSLDRAATTEHRLDNEESYRLSKAAVNMLAVIEARDFGPKGMKVLAMCPGFVVSNLRGTSEEARTGWGGAGDPMVSGELVLSIVNGERDADLGKLVHTSGVYPW